MSKTKQPVRITRFGKPIADVIATSTVQSREAWIGSMKDSIQIPGEHCLSRQRRV